MPYRILSTLAKHNPCRRAAPGPGAKEPAGPDSTAGAFQWTSLVWAEAGCIGDPYGHEGGSGAGQPIPQPGLFQNNNADIHVKYE